MTAAQTLVRDETEQIEAWRAEALERAGYAPSAVFELAARHDVDLHKAIDLLANGCPADVALEILL